jgi:hypothetical protein
MTNNRFAPRVGRDQLLEIADASRQALVLTQVFRPGDHDECLEIGVGPFEIAIETPS